LDSPILGNENKNSSKSIVVLGAGVAGIKIVKALQGKLPDSWRLVLIEENDYHQYLYKIHEVCNIKFNKEDIIVPLKKIIDANLIDFKQMKIESVNTSKSLVFTDRGSIPYDILAIGLGSHPAYYNIEGIQEHSLTLGSFEQALEIRIKILELLNKAKETGIPLKIVIGGGGFSGVELAGELIELLRVRYEEDGVVFPDKLVTIVEALPYILPGWDKDLSLLAQNYIEKMGGEIIFSNPVKKVEKNYLEMSSGQILEYDVLIWTGGVGYDPACGLDFEINNRRIVIDEFCRAKDQEKIYVAGDSACAVDSDGRPQPPTAHIAMVQGEVVAHNILSHIKGKPKKKYKFERVGEIITLGRSNALGDLFGFKFKGILARFLKKMVHYWYVNSIGGFRLLLWE
jgi:NADH dehydrogenase